MNVATWSIHIYSYLCIHMFTDWASRACKQHQYSFTCTCIYIPDPTYARPTASFAIPNQFSVRPLSVKRVVAQCSFSGPAVPCLAGCLLNLSKRDM